MRSVNYLRRCSRHSLKRLIKNRSSGIPQLWISSVRGGQSFVGGTQNVKTMGVCVSVFCGSNRSGLMRFAA